jgi:hypothetical protein
MSCRISAFAISAFLLAGPANAQVLATAATPQPAAGCTAKAAKPAQINALATNPKAFAGKCVKLKGFWRDIGIYPTAGEANQPDALSVVFLDQRRVGLYQPPKDEETMPRTPVEATLVGTAGDCASLGAPGSDSTIGYCHYKGGAYLAVAGIERAK